jgi:hypothetical protein
MQPIKIFFSCAPSSSRDKKYVDKLEKLFADKKRNNEVIIWHVHKTLPGTHAKQERLEKLYSADIILIFVSSDYMSDDYCVDVEGSKAATMHSRKVALVRVLYVRPTDIQNAPFNFCDVLPSNGGAISTLHSYKEEEVLLDIAQAIFALVKEARNNRPMRETKRSEYKYIVNRSHPIYGIPPIESLIKAKQIDNIKPNQLERKTDDIKKEKQTDDFPQRKTSTRARKTDDFPQRKTTTRARKRKQVLPDSIVTSEYISTRKIKPLPKTQSRIRNTQTNYKQRVINTTGWLQNADKEYKLLSKGNKGILFLYPMIIIDSFGIAAAIYNWANSLLLTLFYSLISLLCVVIGAINTGNKLPIPLAILYSIIWGFIIAHYLQPKPIIVIGVMAIIAFSHFLLFRKNSR